MALAKLNEWVSLHATEVVTMKVLIGYDGSECADAALDDLMQAGLPATGGAPILSVAGGWLPPAAAAAGGRAAGVREAWPGGARGVGACRTSAQSSAN